MIDLNKVFTKEAPFEIGQRKTFDIKFMPATDVEMAKFLEDTNRDELPDGYVAGWASTEAIDKVRDVVRKGAFDKAIAKRGLTGPMGIKLLIQHDHDKPAGRIVKLEQREKGLWIEAEMNLNISYVRDMYEASKIQGGLNFSIGYRLVDGGFKFVDLGENSYWELTELDLFEVSVVTFPCNDEAQMLFIKAINDDDTFDTIAEFEKALVASGLVKSRNDAARFTKMAKRNGALFATPAKPLLVAEQDEALDEATKAIARLSKMFGTK